MENVLMLQKYVFYGTMTKRRQFFNNKRVEIKTILMRMAIVKMKIIYNKQIKSQKYKYVRS